MSAKRTAVVLGGGSWGTALAHIAATHGFKTLLWMRNKEMAAQINATHENTRYLGGYPIHENVEATTDLALAAGFARTLVVAIPSKAMRKVAFDLGDHLTGDQILVSATKGLEMEGLTRMSEVLLQETCIRQVGALSGPNLAKEVMEGQPSATVVASRFEEVIEECEHLFAGPRFRVYGNADIVGVELAGALKNIVAIAAGVVAGLGLGANTLSMLITRGLSEIVTLGRVMGADPLTFGGLAGIGDLIATCSSPLSRNQTVGRRLAQGETLDDVIADLGMVAEGVHTTRSVVAHTKRLGITMPVAEGMYEMLYNNVPAEKVIEGLMARTSVYEGSNEVIHATNIASRSVMEHAASAAYRARTEANRAQDGSDS